MGNTIVAGMLKPCCRIAENLAGPIDVGSGLKVWVCRVCKCRHFRAKAEAFKVIGKMRDAS